jgi:nucleoside-diphosphate-sugar epimerase
MSILVTGATGFIGRHLVERVIREGEHIRALVRPETDASLLSELGVEVVRGDVRDYQAVERAAANCGLVFHLAAKTEALELPRKAVQAVNAKGTENVVRAAVRAGVDRFVLCSSAGVYGRVIKDLSIDEDTKTKPDSPYGESKVCAEQIARSHHERDGLPVVVARVASVLGPGASSWLGLFKTIASGRFRLMGSGNNHHHLVEVSDVVEALVRCAYVKGVEGRTYIIAGSEPVRLRDLVRMIGEDVGGPQILNGLPVVPLHLYKVLNKLIYTWSGQRLPRADRIDFFLGDRIFDISRGRMELGYAPKVNTGEAVRRTAEWFRAQGHLARCR